MKKACAVAKELMKEGINALELRGAFGNIGVAKVTEAIESKVSVGVVRFDNHPGFKGETVDSKF